MSFLPPIIATLLADTKEFMAKMDEAEHKVGKFGAASEVASSKFDKFSRMASTAVVGAGAAIAAYGVEKAIKFNDALDKIQNQAGASATEIAYLKNAIFDVSNQTGISTDHIATAFMQVEKAGIRGSKAYDLVSAAAKTADITGGDVTSTTQTLIGIQNLQIAKGMSVAQVSDLMVLANQRHVGSLDSLQTVLTGRVGGALSAVGFNLAEMASVADVAAASGYNNARAYATLATGMNKLENPTKASSKALGSLGINADTLAKAARHPGTGLVDVLQMLEATSKRTGISMNTLITDTFGAGSVGLVTTLANHINTLKDNIGALNGASGKGLKSAFGDVAQQFDTKLKIVETRLVNSATQFGLALMPYIQKAVDGISSAMDYLSKHPAAVSNIGIGLAGVFAASMATKVVGLGIKMAQAFGAESLAVEAGPVGLAIGAGVAVALELWKNNAPSNADITAAQNEWATNKVGGAYDIAALTVNTLLGWLPGHPGLPVIGNPNAGPGSSQAGGTLSSYSPFSPGAGGKGAPTTHTIKVKVTR